MKSILMIVKIQIWLLYLLPITLFLGNGLIEITISLLGILFIIQCFIEKKYTLFKQSFFIMLLLLWLYMVMRSIFAENAIESLERSLAFIRFPIFALSVQSLIISQPKFLNDFIKVLIGTLTIISCNLILQYLSGYNLFGIEPVIANENYFRLTTLAGKMIPGIIITTIAFPAICYAFYNLLGKNNSKQSLLYIAFLTTSFIGVILSGERMAFLLMLCGYSLIFLNFVKKYFKVVFISMLAMCVLIIGITEFFPKIFNRQITQVTQEIQDFENTSYYRIFHDSWQIAQTNVIFGVGTKNFRHACKTKNYSDIESQNSVTLNQCGTHPHNLYLELLCENGLIGLTLFLIFLYFVFKKILINIRNIYAQPIYYGAVINFILKIIPILSSASLFIAWANVSFWLIIGIIFSIKNSDSKKII